MYNSTTKLLSPKRVRCPITMLEFHILDHVAKHPALRLYLYWIMTETSVLLELQSLTNYFNPQNFRHETKWTFFWKTIDMYMFTWLAANRMWKYITRLSVQSIITTVCIAYHYCSDTILFWVSHHRPTQITRFDTNSYAELSNWKSTELELCQKKWKSLMIGALYNLFTIIQSLYNL